MEGSQQIPADVQAVADKLGVDVHALLAAQQAAQQAQAPADVPAQTAEGVQVVPTETEQQKLEREKAVLEQELQQTRDLARRADEGRVVGSGGLGGVPGTESQPNLGSIEPGIRWAYLNGLLTDDDLTNKVGPLLAELLKAHQGGVI